MTYQVRFNMLNKIQVVILKSLLLMLNLSDLSSLDLDVLELINTDLELCEISS